MTYSRQQSLPLNEAEIVSASASDIGGMKTTGYPPAEPTQCPRLLRFWHSPVPAEDLRGAPARDPVRPGWPQAVAVRRLDETSFHVLHRLHFFRDVSQLF